MSDNATDNLESNTLVDDTYDDATNPYAALADDNEDTDQSDALEHADTPRNDPIAGVDKHNNNNTGPDGSTDMPTSLKHEMEAKYGQRTTAYGL